MLRPAALFVLVLAVACGGGGQRRDPPPPQQQLPDVPPIVVAPPPPPPPPAADEKPLDPPQTPPPLSPSPEAPRTWTYPALQTSLPRYTIVMSKESADAFKADTGTAPQPAQFCAAGRCYDVEIELRGASSRKFPKKSWNVSFPDGVTFEGRDDLNLIAEFQDSTMMVEKLAYDLLEALAVKAPRGKYVTVDVLTADADLAVARREGFGFGVFLDLEQVDKKFTRAHGWADSDPTIYRCGWKGCEFTPRDQKPEYQGRWTKRTDEDEPDDELDAILEVINRTPDQRLEAELRANVDLDSWLKTMVVDALISNNYVEDSESYFIRDAVKKQWRYVPWDLNNADARYWYTYELSSDGTAEPYVEHPMVGFSILDRKVESVYRHRLRYGYPGYLPTFSTFNTRIALHPDLRGLLLTMVDRALEELFDEEKTHARIDAIHRLLDPQMQKEFSVSPEHELDPAEWAAGRRYLKDYVTGRIRFLRAELARLRAMEPSLMLARVDPAADTIDIVNRTRHPIDLGSVVVTTRLRQSISSVPGINAFLPPQHLAPGAQVTVSLSELGLDLQDGGELALMNGTSVVGLYDAIYYGRSPQRAVYVREPQPPFRWKVESAQ